MVKTQRLWLRNLRESDVPAVWGWRNDPDCFRYQRWEATSAEAVAAYVKRFENSQFLSEEEEQHYAVCAGQEIVGELAYFYTDKDRCVTLGITIGPAHQRKGYAREILMSVVNAVRRAYPKLDIVALIDRENKGSIALFEKVGFKLECYAEKIGSYVYVINGE